MAQWQDGRVQLRDVATGRWRQGEDGTWAQHYSYYREVYVPGLRYAIPVDTDPEVAIAAMVARFEAELRAALAVSPSPAPPRSG